MLNLPTIAEIIKAAPQRELMKTVVDEIKSTLAKLNRGTGLRVGPHIINVETVRDEMPLEWQKQYLPKILDELKASLERQ